MPVAAAEARAPRAEQMKHIWTAVLRSCAAPLPADVSPARPPRPLLATYYLFVFPKKQPKFKTFSTPNARRGQIPSNTRFNFHGALGSKEQKQQQQKPSRYLTLNWQRGKNKVLSKQTKLDHGEFQRSCPPWNLLFYHGSLVVYNEYSEVYLQKAKAHLLPWFQNIILSIGNFGGNYNSWHGFNWHGWGAVYSWRALSDVI
ncbi:hypothetical protein H8959_020710 [Pygathrix nigripes]